MVRQARSWNESADRLRRPLWSRVALERYSSAIPAASHIGVFGEGSGEGVFAKTPSPETLASAGLRDLCGETLFDFRRF